MLDMECFSFLNRALENELAPLVIMASNRGMATIRGTTYKSPHGLPPDLLDRVLIISTSPYTQADIEQIIQIRCAEEDVQLTPKALEALALLSSNAQTASLRYTLNLIATAQVVARKRKSPVVDVVDVGKCYKYFLDEKRSTEWLASQQGGMMVFDELLVVKDITMAAA